VYPWDDYYVGKLMREHAVGCRVSPDAVKEFIGFLETEFEKIVPELCRIAESHKRKTVFPDDVIEYFGYVKNHLSREQG
jgi:histone H3/H4